MNNFNAFLIALKDKLVSDFKIGDIGAEISRAIAPKQVFTLNLGFFNLVVTDAIVATWVVMLAILFLAILMGHNPKRVPAGKRQHVSESLIMLLMKLCQTSNLTYEQSEEVVPYVGAIAVFISLTNLSSMFGIAPPAKNPAFPIALALFTLVYVIRTSIRFAGWKGFWNSLIYPKAMLLPFKILDYLIKPVSLSLRLFGNIFGAFILMEFVYLIVPVILPGVVGLWFDLADGILQGVIFTYLTVTYIGEVIEGAHSAHLAQAAKHS
jgi:F-type H+-transporting ATPase subunit a